MGPFSELPFTFKHWTNVFLASCVVVPTSVQKTEHMYNVYMYPYVNVFSTLLERRAEWDRVDHIKALQFGATLQKVNHHLRRCIFPYCLISMRIQLRLQLVDKIISKWINASKSHQASACRLCKEVMSGNLVRIFYIFNSSLIYS